MLLNVLQAVVLLVKMDAVFAGTGLASCIITFLEFSWKIVAGANQLRRAKLGTSEENLKISVIIADLEDLALDLSVDDKHLHGSKHELALRNLAVDCNVLSHELVQKLRQVKFASKLSRWQSFRAQWAILRKSGEIASIENRLAHYRSQITVRLLGLFMSVKTSQLRWVCLYVDSLTKHRKQVRNSHQ